MRYSVKTGLYISLKIDTPLTPSTERDEQNQEIASPKKPGPENLTKSSDLHEKLGAAFTSTKYIPLKTEYRRPSHPTHRRPAH